MAAAEDDGVVEHFSELILGVTIFAVSVQGKAILHSHSIWQIIPQSEHFNKHFPNLMMFQSQIKCSRSSLGPF